MLFSPQMPLQLEPRKSGGFADFVAGPNRSAVEAVKGAAVEPDTSVFLSAPPGHGKTHLLNAACVLARQHQRTAFFLGLRSAREGGPEVLQGLEAMSLVCLDDLHQVAGDKAWEEGLFHFINRLRQHKGSLIVTSRQRLSALPLELPDLASRLAWGLRVELGVLGETDKLNVMHSRAQALGIEIPDEVAAYLLRHGDRSLSSLVAAVEVLQRAAFTDKRRITVPMAREVLKAV